MEIRLQKWGNSIGIRIPKSILNTLNLSENDKVELVQEGEKMVITKSMKKKISLRERFDKYQGSNLAKEFSWDEAKGKEIW